MARPSLRSVLRVKGEDLEEIRAGITALADAEILVGFPEETTEDRQDDEPTGITNAALGYIHDNGMPEQNIPARPFMIPGINSVENRISDGLAKIARDVVRTKSSAGVEPGLNAVGSIAELALKKKINEGIPPPLSEYTLRKRMKRVKGIGRLAERVELASRAMGFPASTELAKPLIDTGAMRNAIKYVLRKKSDRR